MSVFVWLMIGIAIWHFAIFVPDRWAGGIIGAFLAACIGAVASGFLLEGLSFPDQNPPGLRHVIWSLPGSVLGLAACWLVGDRQLKRHPELDPAWRPPVRGSISAPSHSRTQE